MALTTFANQAHSYINSYDDQVYISIAQKIVTLLLHDVNNHFARYGGKNTIDALREDVRAQSTNDERRILVAFFHPGGSQRDALEELLDAYYDLADCKETPTTPSLAADMKTC
jgi:hypothetical protein